MRRRDRSLRWILVVLPCLLVATLWIGRSGSRDAHPGPAYFDLKKLAWDGWSISSLEAQGLEQQLEKDPENLAARAKLVGYYSEQCVNALGDCIGDNSEPCQHIPDACNRQLQHVAWIVEHHPEAEFHGYAGLGPFGPDPILDRSGTLSQLWARQAAANTGNATILGNAGRYCSSTDPAKAVDLLQRAELLEPENPDWPWALGKAWYALATESDHPDSQKAQAALAAFERALQKRSGYIRFLALADTAEAALIAGEHEKARNYAYELLDIALAKISGDCYGDAAHTGNLILGHLALARDDLDGADRYLLKAGRTPGSPVLEVFGPDLRLAEALLQKGQKDAVLRYLKLCGAFWTMGRPKLNAWIAAIETGDIPNFDTTRRTLWRN
jgi:hypothetical protein